MSTIGHAISAGSVTPPAAVEVWDPFVRVFDWSLATLFLDKWWGDVLVETFDQHY